MIHILDLLPGIIWSGFLGLAIGNFATNPVYRLPRNESLFARDPYCGDCNAPLKPRDLFPVLSWLSTGGKCRYCGAKVPGAYTLVEAITGVIFVILYLRWGWSERFILASFGATAFVMIAAMLRIDGFFSNRTLAACMMLGMLCRVLQEGTIYGFAGTAYAGAIAGAIAWKLSGRPMARDFSSFPAYLKLLAVAGIWLHWPQFLVLLLAAVGAAILQRATKTAWLSEYSIISIVLVCIIFT